MGKFNRNIDVHDLHFRKHGFDYKNPEYIIGHLVTHQRRLYADINQSKPVTSNSRLFGKTNPLVKPMKDGLFGSYHTGLDGPEVIMIHVLDDFIKAGHPICIFYGKFDGFPKNRSLPNTWKVGMTLNKDQDNPENFDDQKEFYEYSSHSLGGTNITGAWLKGVALNYLFGVDKFLHSSYYFVGNLIGGIPSPSKLSKEGITHVCTYYNGSLVSPSVSTKMSNVPLRETNKLTTTSSVLRLLEYVKGGVAQG